MKKRLFQFFKKYWPIFIFILISLLFFYPVFLENKIPLPTDALVGAHIPWSEVKWKGYPAGVPIKNQEITDAISQFYPWRKLVGEFWRAGKVPLWNPYMFNGTPFLATLHSAALYPLNLLYVFFNDYIAWSSLVFSQILLSGIFMYVFLRSLNLRNIASLMGGITFAFSGYMVAWLEFATGGHAGLWLPLLLYFERKMLLEKKAIYVIAVVATYFMIFTAGDFQVPLFISITYLLFGAYLIYFEIKQKKESLKNLIYLIFVFILGIILSAPQLLPTIELFLQSVRQYDPYIKEYFYGLMGWEKITNFIWPDFFGNIVTRNYWGKYGFHEYISYVGIIPLVYVFYSFIVKKAILEKFFWFLLFISLIFLFPTPFGLLPYKLQIPGLSTSSASRIIYLVDFSLAALTAYGIDKWLKSKDTKLLKTTFLITVLCCISMGLLRLIMLNSQYTNFTYPTISNLSVSFRNMIPQTVLLIFFLCVLTVFYKAKLVFGGRKIENYFLYLTVVLMMLLSLADILRFAWKNTAFGPIKFLFPETEITNYLSNNSGTSRIAGGIPTNLFMPYKLYSAEGYDPLYPEKNSRWYSIVDWGNTDNLGGRYGIIHYFESSAINYAAVKYIVDYKKDIHGQINSKGDFYKGVDSLRYLEVFREGEITIFENKKALPYVWLTNNYFVAENINDSVNKMIKSDYPILLLNKTPREILGKNNPKYSVTEIVKGYNEIKFNTSSDEDSLLFLSESYYPGWKAYVDGKDSEIFVANYLFQSIFIPKGEHLVSFQYKSMSYKIGIVSCIITVSLLIGLWVYERKSININPDI